MTTKRKKAAKPSTALVRRSQQIGRNYTRAVRQASRPAALIPAPGQLDANLLGEETSLGALGLVEIKLTPAEEKVLGEPVREADVEIKPNGRAYLSHPAYTRWFNRAFGRLGWGLVPRAKPMRSGNSVVTPYILYIHGKPAALAWGEQEYFEGNRDQTYGDALEATVASALRRCAKRLGVGLELWDRAWVNRWVSLHAVEVRTTDTKTKGGFKWRRKIDPPFWNEVTQPRIGDGMQTQQRSRTEAPGHTDANQDEPITAKQRQRLFVMLRNSKRDEATFRAWLKGHYGLDSTKAIKRRDYETICDAIESPAPMFSTPPRVEHEREPGEEG